MRGPHFRKIIRALFCGSTVVIFAGIALPHSVLAQEADAKPTSETENTRHFIYSRDVSYGHAIGPRTPGREHSVETGPTDLILSTLATGLQPISDSESAGIVAGAFQQAELIGSHGSLGMNVLTATPGTGDPAASLGNVQGSVVNGAVGQATGAIGEALGSVSGILGGGQ